MPAIIGFVGGEPSDETVVWQYAPADRRAVASGGIAEVAGGREIDPEPRGEGGVSDKTGWEGRDQQLGTRRLRRSDRAGRIKVRGDPSAWRDDAERAIGNFALTARARPLRAPVAQEGFDLQLANT